MSNPSPLHVVQRADGVWQIEHEDEVLPLSLHERREDAIDSALDLAIREHRPLAVHRRPRPAARWVDRVAWALLDSGPRAERTALRRGA